jgi:hypothetical protein
MESILLKVADFGALAAIAGALLYDVFFLQRKLIQIIENNTKAMTDLRTYCAMKNNLDRETV